MWFVVNKKENRKNKRRANRLYTSATAPDAPQNPDFTWPQLGEDERVQLNRSSFLLCKGKKTAGTLNNMSYKNVPSVRQTAVHIQRTWWPIRPLPKTICMRAKEKCISFFFRFYKRILTLDNIWPSVCQCYFIFFCIFGSHSCFFSELLQLCIPLFRYFVLFFF